MPDIVIHVVDERPAKPPLVRLIVDVHITNSTDTSAWVAIGSRVPTGTGGVDAMEQFVAGAVKFARFLGTGGFYAVALAPRASLILKNLEIGWWTDGGMRPPPPVEVCKARSFTIGSDPIESWFRGDALVHGAAQADASTASPTHSRRTDRELAVTAGDGTSQQIALQAHGPSTALDPPEWRLGFPVPKGARRDPVRSGATSLGPGKNHEITSFDVDASLETVTAFVSRHLTDAQRTEDGDVVRFARANGTAELRRTADGCTLTIRVGPF